MPKAVAIRKSKHINKNEPDRNNNVSESVDLFDVPFDVSVDDNSVNHSGNQQAQGQEKSETERKGTRGFQTNVRCNDKGSQADRGENRVQRDEPEENDKPCADEARSVDGEKQRRKGTTGTSGRGKGKVHAGKKTDDTVGNAVKAGERHPERNEGIQKGRSGTVQDEKLNPDAFKRGEFKDSNTVMTHKPVIHGPYSTEDPFSVDIVLDDGLLYRVSACSVKDGTYIQGFDSMYITRKFHPYLK